MNRVEGKNAFITGIARGQGRAHAVKLAAEGAAVAGIDICQQIDSVPYAMSSSSDLAETVRQVEDHGGKIVASEADVRDFAGLSAAVKASADQLGKFDILIVNAGIWSTSGSVSEFDERVWQDLIDVNLTGAFNTLRACIPYLNDGASIVLVSSGAGSKGASNLAHYVAAKHGMAGLMKTAAMELSYRGIRVNAVQPTTVDTDMFQHKAMYNLFRPDLDEPGREDVIELGKQFNLLPIPWVEAEDVANAVLFLVSDEARYITGVSLPVDGGFAIK